MGVLTRKAARVLARKKAAGALPKKSGLMPREGKATFIQDLPIVKEDLAPYRGRWVAIRDGAVVGASETSSKLRHQPGVRSSDSILRVPKHAGILAF